MTRDEAVAELRQMADYLESVPEDKYNGAFIVLPPGGGKKVDGVFLSSNQDLVTFWANASGIIKLEIDTMSASERQDNPGFRGRLR